MSQVDAKNMRLAAQDGLAGFGNIGEGVSLQVTGGRRILWLAHESAPKNFTGVDVTHPKKPRVIVQTDLPQAVELYGISKDAITMRIGVTGARRRAERRAAYASGSGTA